MILSSKSIPVILLIRRKTTKKFHISRKMVLLLNLFHRSPIKSLNKGSLLQKSCHFSSAPDSLIIQVNTIHNLVSFQRCLTPLYKLQGSSYPRDSVTNISPRILKCMDRNLHLQPSHPLCLIKQRIANYMYKVMINASTR